MLWYWSQCMASMLPAMCRHLDEVRCFALPPGTSTGAQPALTAVQRLLVPRVYPRLQTEQEVVDEQVLQPLAPAVHLFVMTPELPPVFPPLLPELPPGAAAAAGAKGIGGAGCVRGLPA